LFDLETDAGERNDLAVTHAAMLPEFRTMLATWEADVDASRKVPASSP
jgi:hypothetical protein